jgi:hypothetical protein
MKKKYIAIFATFLVLTFAGSAYADVSVQLKRTNNGVIGEQNAEIIFDVVNTGMSTKIEGFLLCRSPDDVLVSSSLGAGAGSGAQYISPKFYINEGPSQKALSLYLEGTSTGPKRASCTIKYLQFREEATDTNSAKKVYILLNGNEVENPTDSDYSELRLDNTVAFTEKAEVTEEETAEGEGDGREFEASARGICGPSALLVLAAIPLGVAALFRKRS